MLGKRTIRNPKSSKRVGSRLSPASSGVALGTAPRLARAAYRGFFDPSYRLGDLGFRCAELRPGL